MKSNIVYNSNELLVSLSGDTIMSDYYEIKRKMELIINTYKIDNIVFDITNLESNNILIDDLKKTYKNIKLLK